MTRAQWIAVLLLRGVKCVGVEYDPKDVEKAMRILRKLEDTARVTRELVPEESH